MLNQKGLSLLGVAFAGAIVTLGVLALMRSFASANRVFSFFDTKGKAEQVLSSTASGMIYGIYDDLYNSCTQANALLGPRSGKCSKNGQLDTATLSGSSYTPPSPNPFQLEMLRDLKGDPSPQGTICIEIYRCNRLAQGKLLEVSLNAYWLANQKTVNKTLTIRRTHW